MGSPSPALPCPVTLYILVLDIADARQSWIAYRGHRTAMDGIINIGKREAIDLLLAHHLWLQKCETLALAHPNQVATGATGLPDHIKHWWVYGGNSRPPPWPRLLQLYRNPSEVRTSLQVCGS